MSVLALRVWTDGRWHNVVYGVASKVGDENWHWVSRQDAAIIRPLYGANLLAIARDVEGDPRKTLGLVKKEVPDG